MAGSQLQYLKHIIDKPTYVLKRDFAQNGKIGRHSSSLYDDGSGCYIHDIQEETIQMGSGTRKSVNRIFATAPEDEASTQRSYKIRLHPYSKVGWVANEDIAMCMLCKKDFASQASVFSNVNAYKHHCKACGNVICEDCSPSRVEIFEVRELGALRVCMMCDYGQVSG
jgi:hypothetical protein